MNAGASGSTDGLGVSSCCAMARSPRATIASSAVPPDIGSHRPARTTLAAPTPLSAGSIPPRSRTNRRTTRLLIATRSADSATTHFGRTAFICAAKTVSPTPSCAAITTAPRSISAASSAMASALGRTANSTPSPGANPSAEKPARIAFTRRANSRRVTARPFASMMAGASGARTASASSRALSEPSFALVTRRYDRRTHPAARTRE